MLSRALLVWAALLSIAVVNGAVREGWLIPRVGESIGHIVSTLLLSAAIAAVSWFVIGWIAPAMAGEAIAVGALWVGLTLAFEFGAGHYVFGRPWNELLADYDVAGGRIWPLVLVVTFAAPPVSGLARGVISW